MRQCYEKAGMLLAPEKVTLTKTESSDGAGDGNPFTIEVSAPAYADGDVTYEAVLYRKSPNEADFKQIDFFEFGSSMYTFSLSEEIIDEGGEIYVKVKAVQKTDNKKSAEVQSNTVTIGNVMPDPELRIELKENGNGYEYRLSLEKENQEKYATYDPNNELGLTAYVTRMDSNVPISFPVSGTGKIDLTQASLQQLIVQVKSTNDPNDVKESSEISVPVYLPKYTPEISLKDSVPNCTVTGTNLQDLRIQVAIPGRGGNVTTPPIYRAELIGTWEDESGTEHVNTVFQSADILTTTSGQATAVFANLPDYMATASNIRVRVWYAESGLGPVYTYSDKLGNGSAVVEATANVKTLKKVTETQPDGTQTEKYEWEYTYTPVLNESNKDTFEDYNWTSGELFTLLPAPVLMDNTDVLTPEINADTGHLQYTFKWDMDDKYTENSNYIVSLTGIAKDESTGEERRVSILTNQEVPDNNNPQPAGQNYYSITPDAENWSYSAVELTVTRKGDANNIGLTSTKTYQVKRRLPQPGQPKVTIINNDELDYEIEWDAIAPEWDGSVQETGCVFYEIYVQPYKEDDNLTLEDENPVIAKIPVIDADGNPTAENGVYKTSVDLENIEITRDDGTVEKVSYAGKRVAIYIKALPGDNDNSYVRSIDGVIYNLDVPKRLGEPKIEWTKNWEHKVTPPKPDADNQEPIKETILTVDEFQDGGMTVNVKVTDDESIPPGDSAYLLKAYVFDFNSTDADEIAKAIEEAEAAIESGAEEEIEGLVSIYPPSEEEGNRNPIPVSMEVVGNDGRNYSHDLAGLSAEYAGKYILFYARISSGGGNISSPWVSSECWQLPYVKLPTPEVEVGSEDSDIKVTLIYNPDLTGDGTSSYGAEQKADAEKEDEEKKETTGVTGGSLNGTNGNLSNTDKTPGGEDADDTLDGDKTPDGDDADNTLDGNKTPDGDDGNKTPDRDSTDKTPDGEGSDSADKSPDGEETDKTLGSGANNTDNSSDGDNTGKSPDGDDTDKSSGKDSADKTTGKEGTDSISGDGTNKADKALDISAVKNSEVKAESLFSKAGKVDSGKAEFIIIPSNKGVRNSYLFSESEMEAYVKNPVLLAAATRIYHTADLKKLPGAGEPEDDDAEEKPDRTAPADDSTDKKTETKVPADDSTDKKTDTKAPADDSADKKTDTKVPADDSTEKKTDTKVPADDSTDKKSDTTGSTDDSAGEFPEEEDFEADGAELYGVQPLAEDPQEEDWTAKHITLSWNSVELADSYYIMLTEKVEGTDAADTGEKLHEFKIVETKSPDDGTVVSATVYEKDADDKWQIIQEIEKVDISADNPGECELPYFRDVKGDYEKQTGYMVPYEVNLTAKLRVEETQDETGGLKYTLILPDADSLTPKDGGNSIKDDNLRFTSLVQIYADVQENEDMTTAPSYGSDAYVRSDPYEMTIEN